MQNISVFWTFVVVDPGVSPDLGSEFFHPGPRVKIISDLSTVFKYLTQKIVSKLSKI